MNVSAFANTSAASSAVIWHQGHNPLPAPFAWWIMNKWLQDFVYRVNFSWWIFFAAGLAALLIALLTVSYQAVRAAMANPVKSLRTE